MTETYHEESDIGIAAYLSMKGKQLVEVSVSNSRPYRFFFLDQDGTCPKLAEEYMLSEYKLFDNCIRDIRQRIHLAKKNNVKK